MTTYIDCCGYNECYKLLFTSLSCVVTAGKTGLEKEQEFIRKCMESLLMASANLEKDAHSSLTSIERGLLMLKTHLEAFRRRYKSLPTAFMVTETTQKQKPTSTTHCFLSLSGLRITCGSGRSRGRASAAT